MTRKKQSRLISIVCLICSVGALSFNPHTLANTAKSGSGSASKASSKQQNALLLEAKKIKQEFVELDSEIDRLESQILYPPNVQLSVFVSMADRTRFRMDSIELSLDGDLVSTHLYEQEELQALKQGGVQKLHVASIAKGKHTIKARFNGQGVNGNYYRREKTLKFEKGDSSKYLQIEVYENKSTGEPLFKAKQW